jgi:methionyl-tRNA formyltransferase
MDIAWIFFVHWSLHVPESIYSSFKCVGFHMSDLPFGRGGSPLQNLILGGHKQTMISAFRVESELDAGPVYLKSPVSLKGSAEEILQRVSREIFNMIRRIISENLEPTAQQGEVHLFRRRKPSESEITQISSIRALYDFVRMLDAEGYPRAFLRVGGSKIVLSNARLSSDEETLEVTLKFYDSD